MNVFFKIIIAIVTIFFIFHYFTKEYLNPYKLIMVFGKKGAGKTTYLTKTAIKAIKKGKKVYSTIEIPGTTLFDPSDIGFYDFEPESIVLIDEVGMVWDNRDYKNFKPQTRDFFKLQRHAKLKIYLFSQTFDIDKKLRDLTDEMYLLNNRLRIWSSARRIDKTITISKSVDAEGNKMNSTLVEDYKFAPIIFPGSLELTFIPRWVVFYDSYEYIYKQLINGSYTEFSERAEPFLDNKYFRRYLRNKMKTKAWNSIKELSKKIWSWLKQMPRRCTEQLQCSASRVAAFFQRTSNTLLEKKEKYFPQDPEDIANEKALMEFYEKGNKKYVEEETEETNKNE